VPLNKESITPTFAHLLGGATFADLGSFHFPGIGEAVVFHLLGLLLTYGPFGLFTFLPYLSWLM
jgi:hypothetical protein